MSRNDTTAPFHGKPRGAALTRELERLRRQCDALVALCQALYLRIDRSRPGSASRYLSADDQAELHAALRRVELL